MLVPAVWSKGRFYSEGIGEATDDTHTVTWDDGSTPSIVEATKIIAEPATARGSSHAVACDQAAAGSRSSTPSILRSGSST